MAAWLLRRLVTRNDSWLLHCPISQTPVCSRGVSRASPASGALSTMQDKPRTAEDLPRVSFLELLYRLVFQGFYNRLHELQLYEKQLYGPIYRDGIGSVCLNTPELVEEILRKDDKFPCRGDMGVWREYRDMRGFGYGPFTD
ncbi:sterol 26-hydroxylase, mitochondrial-like [Archocentrus centrarchus]|uniref:sterol 26-hydroxylase, mitochondrial-like n=1 Tax=Archocentrus centrarchus TaxID=63155 RepID=UPI0011EA2364|nr:sterol 26-hydroxylase, mitochondrial-like [Archocentrus centrarchus]